MKDKGVPDLREDKGRGTGKVRRRKGMGKKRM